MDWRIATMKATNHLRGDKGGLSLDFQNFIWEFLGVIETKGPDAEEKGKELLEKLCNDAIDLALMMRKSKDQFFIQNMAEVLGKPISEFEFTVEEDASEAIGSSGKQPQTVACILAGALVKIPKENPTEKIVLEKASAVVYN